jgi:hypothetical protein
VAAIAGEMREGLGHEGGAKAVPLGDGLDHVLEKAMPISGLQDVAIEPVHLELAVRVLVVVLVRAPAERRHRVADLADHVEAAHQRLLVVAGLGLESAGSAIAPPSAWIRKYSASTPVLAR